MQSSALHNALERSRKHENRKAYLWALLTALLALIPWLAFGAFG